MTAIKRIDHDLFTQISFPVGPVRTLAWCDDHLVDWADGHVRFELDGTIRRAGYTAYGPRFDAAIAATDGRHAVIYERLGTKAFTDGRELYRWKGVFSGTQASSMCLSQKPPIPPLALDGPRGRFAVVANDTLVIVEIKLDELSAARASS